jgi:hypothetical protein
MRDDKPINKPRRRRGNPQNVVLADLRKERMPKVIRMYLKGIPVMDIAAHFKLERPVIYKDLSLARKIWNKRVDRAARELMSVELAKVDTVEEEAWEQWERSKKDAEEQTVDKDADGKVTGKSKKRKGQSGDPSYLAIILKCVDQRCKMLKIGEYAAEGSGELMAKLVEVVIDDVKQIPAIMDFDDYEKMLDAGKTVDAVSTTTVEG